MLVAWDKRPDMLKIRIYVRFYLLILSSYFPDKKKRILQNVLSCIYVCIYFILFSAFQISNCLFFLCRLKINHMMVTNSWFILEVGVATNETPCYIYPSTSHTLFKSKALKGILTKDFLHQLFKFSHKW
jgi:hypothetical protein